MRQIQYSIFTEESRVRIAVSQKLGVTLHVNGRTRRERSRPVLTTDGVTVLVLIKVLSLYRSDIGDGEPDA